MSVPFASLPESKMCCSHSSFSLLGWCPTRNLVSSVLAAGAGLGLLGREGAGEVSSVRASPLGNLQLAP